MNRLQWWWAKVSLADNWRYEYAWSTMARPDWSGWYPYGIIISSARNPKWATGRVQYQRGPKHTYNPITVEVL